MILERCLEAQYVCKHLQVKKEERSKQLIQQVQAEQEAQALVEQVQAANAAAHAEFNALRTELDERTAALTAAEDRLRVIRNAAETLAPENMDGTGESNGSVMHG